MAPSTTDDSWIRFVVLHSQSPMALVTTDGTILEASSGFARAFGVDRNEPASWNLSTLTWDVPSDSFLDDLATPTLGRSALARRVPSNDAVGGDSSLVWSVSIAGVILGEQARTHVVLAAAAADDNDLLPPGDIAIDRDGRDSTDALTGVATETRLRAHLEAILAGPAERRDSLCVLQLDLEHFPLVTENAGEAVADSLLLEFADRLKQQIRRHDMVARVGPDSFVIAYQARETDQFEPTSVAVQVAERMRRIAGQPFTVKGEMLFLGSAGGLAKPRGETTVDQLLRQARAASQHSRAGGARRVEMFSDALRNTTLRRLALERELQAAAIDRQLNIVFQPMIDLRDGAAVGVEALARWNHPRLGELSPEQFIPLAEDCGAIGAIGVWVLDNAVAALSRWRDQRLVDESFRLAINLSARQLTDDFVQHVAAVLAEWNLPADLVELELTESLLIDQDGDAFHTLQRLRAMGLRLAVDDFGTGYSSMKYLQTYPISSVKLDRMFVADLRSDGSGGPVAESVIRLAGELGITVAGEGVESLAQLEGLRSLGCDTAQGFYFTRPLSQVEMSAFLRAQPTW